MFKVNHVNPGPMIYMVTGSGGLKKGQLATYSSGTAIAATEGISTAIILGVAMKASAENAIAEICPIGGKEIEMDIYQGGATDVAADTNLGPLYDIYVDGTSGEMFLDINDTTNPFVLINRYDNTSKKAWCRIPEAYLYVQ